MFSFKKTPVLLTLALSVTAHGADNRPARDFSAELSRVSDALIGQARILADGAHYYAGRNRQGGACLVTVQFDKPSISVTVRDAGSRQTYNEELTADITAKDRDVTSLSVSDSDDALGVSVEREVIPYGKSQADHYAFELHAGLNRSADGIGRLGSVSISRNDKGKVDQRYCGALRPLLALDEESLAAMNAAAQEEFVRQNADDKRVVELGLDTCTLDSADSLTCDASLETDYTPDTLHVTMGIRGGKLEGVKSIDFEPGC